MSFRNDAVRTAGGAVSGAGAGLIAQLMLEQIFDELPIPGAGVVAGFVLGGMLIANRRKIMRIFGNVLKENDMSTYDFVRQGGMEELEKLNPKVHRFIAKQLQAAA